MNMGRSNGCAVIAMALLVGTGCSTIKTNALTSDELSRLEGKTLVLAKYNELPDFFAQTPVNVQFGLMGAAAAVANGNAIIRNNGIEDPALLISRQLAGGLEASHNVQVVEADGYAAVGSSVDQLVGIYPAADFILDVRSTNWSSIYFPSDWNNYRVMYFANARLIDVASRQVVMEERCGHLPEYPDTNQAPSYAELENGVGLKAALAQSTAFCVSHIANKVGLQRPAEMASVTAAE